jgi:pimeloyl-ACP methyl ester carboxylesterase
MATLRLFAAVLLACLLAALAPTLAVGRGHAHIPLPADLSGTHNDVPYRIRVPANWNGTLLVYAHGTRLRAAGGATEPEIAPQPFPVPTPSLEDQLLARGYALAGAEYANSIIDGTRVTHALTAYFNGAVGRPSRVLVWGCSLGGMVSTVLLEKYPRVYDGAVSCAGPGAEMGKVNDGSLAFGLAYDVTFGWPSDRWGPLEDIRDDVVFATDVAPIFMTTLPTTPDKYAKWEFIRLVTKLPVNAFWKPDPQLGVQFFALAMWRATEGRANFETAFHGVVAQNLDHVYTLTAAEKAYLASLGLTNADDLLNIMNGRTNIHADRAARRRAEIWSADGNLDRPLITLHSAFDGLSRTEGEGLLAAEVQREGNEENLVQVFTTLPGHCSFSTGQLLTTLGTLEQWLDTGERPDASSFPTTLGFAAGFVPQPWPFGSVGTDGHHPGGAHRDQGPAFDRSHGKDRR